MGTDAKGITTALGGKWQRRYVLCRCPAHADRTPSLKISDDPDKADGIDVHCFAGCDWRDVKTMLIRERLLPEFEPARDYRPTIRPTLITAKAISASLTFTADDRRWPTMIHRGVHGQSLF